MAADGTPGPADRTPPVRVVLLDALGTLVGLEPPAPALVAALAARGITVGGEAAAAACRAEMGHYRAEHHRAGTADGLTAVRAECAAVLRAALPRSAALDALGDAAMGEVLLESFRFAAYLEAAAVLRALRAAGLTLVVCSNWDLSLHDVLDATGLAPLLDGAAVSAVEGVAKPDARLFARALALAGGAEPAAAVHVGDSVAADVEGAAAAGVRPVLLQRAGDEVRSLDDGRPVPPGVPVLPDLTGLPELLRRLPSGPR